MEISNEYNFPIANYYGNLPDSFKEYKSKLENILWDLEDVVKVIKKIIESNDPLYAEEIYETELEEKFGSLTSSEKNLYNEDYFNACRFYKKKLDYLKENNLLDKHSNFYEKLKEKIIPALYKILPPKEGNNILIEITDINNLFESEVIVTNYIGNDYEFDSIANKAVISLNNFHKNYDTKGSIQKNINDILFPIIKKIDKIIFPDM